MNSTGIPVFKLKKFTKQNTIYKQRYNVLKIYWLLRVIYILYYII